MAVHPGERASAWTVVLVDAARLSPGGMPVLGRRSLSSIAALIGLLVLAGPAGPALAQAVGYLGYDWALARYTACA
jgi:hypothetical protein